jgi:hypothetical protein
MEEIQARKHAEDVWRVMAMLTREENEAAHGTLDAIRKTPAFSAAGSTFSDFFKLDEGWGSRVVARKWRTEDSEIIRNTLAAWLE